MQKIAEEFVPYKQQYGFQKNIDILPAAIEFKADLKHGANIIAVLDMRKDVRQSLQNKSDE